MNVDAAKKNGDLRRTIIVLAALMTVFASPRISAQTRQSKAEPFLAFEAQIGTMLLGALEQSSVISMGGQCRVIGFASVPLTDTFVIREGYFGFFMDIGPRFWPEGRAFDGWFIGVSPGVGLETSNYLAVVTAKAEAGYSWLLGKRGIASVSGGARYAFRHDYVDIIWEVKPIANLTFGLVF